MSRALLAPATWLIVSSLICAVVWLALVDSGLDEPLQLPPAHVLLQIKKLDDCFGQFLVHVTRDGGVCPEIEPEAVAHLVGGSVTLREFTLLVRCPRCGRKAADCVAVARPRPRGVPKTAH